MSDASSDLIARPLQRLRLSRELKLPRLRRLPRRVVALDPSGTALSFTLRLHLSGRLTAVRERGAKLAGTPFVLALDPAICFRRRDRAHPKSRSELRMLASDLFPFQADATQYARSHMGGEEPNYCALPNDELDAILDRFPAPAAIIVAPAQANALGRAVVERLDAGEVADLLPAAGHLINPAAVLSGALGLLLVAGIAGGLYAWSSHYDTQQRTQRAEYARLQAVTQNLVSRRLAVSRMITELEQEQRFVQRPSRSVVDTIAKVLTALPDGSFVDRIEYSKQTLTIAGWGNNAEEWVKKAGLSPQRIVTEKMPLTDHFIITFVVAGS